MTGGRHLVIEAERCCGFGQCVELLPGVFRLRAEDGLAEVADQPLAGCADIETAIRDCPTEAIGWRETP